MSQTVRQLQHRHRMESTGGKNIALLATAKLREREILHATASHGGF